MTDRLTPDQKDLCQRFAEIEPLISKSWLGFRNAKDGRNEIFSSDATQGEPPILIMTEEISWADRELAARAPQTCLALAAALRIRGETIQKQMQEIRQLRGEPDHDSKPKRSKASWCAMVCAAPEFKNWLASLGVDTSDQTRVDNHVRMRLRLQSRAELDTDENAARAWDAMWREFKNTPFGKDYQTRRNLAKEAR